MIQTRRIRFYVVAKKCIKTNAATLNQNNIFSIIFMNRRNRNKGKKNKLK